MYLLSCPNCQAELSVAAAQAGDSISCSSCQSEVAIPKLGELRNLPQTAEGQNEVSGGSRSVGGTIAFVVLSLIAVGALLGAGYNAIRWAMIETNVTHASHLAEIQTEYRKVEPAAMIKEFEDMEKYSLDLVTPYKYQVTANEKSRWGWNAVAAAGLALLCGAGAFIGASRSG
jgi:hypothetical protein